VPVELVAVFELLKKVALGVAPLSCQLKESNCPEFGSETLATKFSLAETARLAPVLAGV